VPARFLKLDEVAEELATSRTQVYALSRSGDLPAIRMGAGRGQWRVERVRFGEAWLQDRHSRAAEEMAEGRKGTRNSSRRRARPVKTQDRLRPVPRLRRWPRSSSPSRLHA
jgi:prophage regulatory protein